MGQGGDAEGRFVTAVTSLVAFVGEAPGILRAGGREDLAVALEAVLGMFKRIEQL